jgi:HK97 family phage portal protein
LTPIGYAARAIELGLTYEAFCINFYKNGANSSLLLKHPRVMKEDAYERLRKSFAEKQAGVGNANKPIIVEEGMDVSQLTINPVDAQLLESKNFQIEDICRIYRVPQHLVNKLDRSTNNNIEHQSLEFIMYTMLPWFKRIEENINLQLLTPDERKAGYFVEFKVDALLRGDAAGRSQAYASGRQWGWLSVNDIRKLENMNAIDDGDIYLQPSNMVEAGTVVETKTEETKPAPEEEKTANIKQARETADIIYDILLEKGVIK